MRIRRKKWAEKELREAKFYIDNPEIGYKDTWRSRFQNPDRPLYIEIGCGKGIFMARLASGNPEINFIAIDMIEAMLGVSKRNIEEAYQDRPINNLFLIRANAERIFEIFGEKDKVDRIYINFCNPWPRKKHKKRRLTHIRQLENYKKFLSSGAEIYFKTDNDELFEESLEYFKEAGFQEVAKTFDLHQEPIFENNIETEHEKMFAEQGIKIKAGIFKI
ncbi:MAG: tRNA (guanosine(46)-N7)-methyltransferase TrmB [Clostridia bacterium]|nr:tRNA (guanosine(46)-N7)-methyltransferase TrmB [Clostridia bacterium]